MFGACSPVVLKKVGNARAPKAPTGAPKAPTNRHGCSTSIYTTIRKKERKQTNKPREGSEAKKKERKQTTQGRDGRTANK